MKICIVGFGAAGLAAARHATTDPNDECVIFERTDSIGGTWVYTDDVGLDHHGLPIHTSMYKSLRTNLPKEIMGYPDFPVPEQEKSYIKAQEILDFLQKYADHFNLTQYVKFNHLVKEIKPDENKWRVTVVDLANNKKEIQYSFDAVMVCSGHYHAPLYPEIKGMFTFSGMSLHSHDYRTPEMFKDKVVVVIGAGPSGIDLALETASVAKKVILSRRKDADLIENVFPSNVTMKCEVVDIDERTVHFEDSSFEEIDAILYCTGYKYTYPFLSSECGVSVIDNCVQPLYKHLIHIEHPTLCFIGLPYYVCSNSLFDLQSRYFLKTLSGAVKLPNKEAMYKDTELEMEKRKQKGLKRKQFHMMGTMQGDYYEELAKAGQLQPLPPVMAKLHNQASATQIENPKSFRDHVYRIIDNENFIEVK